MQTDSISEWQQRVGELMEKKGFHSDFGSSRFSAAILVEQRLLRLIGEVAEAADVVKKEWDSRNVYVRVGDAKFAEELADVLYRLLDLAYLCEVDLAAALAAKHSKNAGRPYRYGTAEAGVEDHGSLGVQYLLPEPLAEQAGAS